MAHLRAGRRAGDVVDRARSARREKCAGGQGSGSTGGAALELTTRMRPHCTRSQGVVDRGREMDAAGAHAA